MGFRGWSDEEWLSILGFLGDLSSALAPVSSRFERLVMSSEHFVHAALGSPEEQWKGWFGSFTDLGRMEEFWPRRQDGRPRAAIYLQGVHLMRPSMKVGAAQTEPLLTLVERRLSRASGQFHDVLLACDDEEVRRAVYAFCDRHGHYRAECLKNLYGTSGKLSGFLFINKLHDPKVPQWIRDLMEADGPRGYREFENHIGKERTQSRVPPKQVALALRQLLLNAPLKGRWSLAVYQPRGEYDMRALLQAGFRQAAELARRGDGDFVFAVPAFLDAPMPPSHVVASMPVAGRAMLPAAPSWPSGPHELLHEEVSGACTQLRMLEIFGTKYSYSAAELPKTQARVQKLIADGASMSRSLGLHLAARSSHLDLLTLCLPFADPNGRDPFGRTPLMRAVRSQERPDKVEACVDKLIGAGADLGMMDMAGLTALGHLWRRARENFEERARDHNGSEMGFLYACWSCDVLVDKLMPSTGPTQADTAVRVQMDDYLQDASSASDGAEEEIEEEEEEEEEEGEDDEDADEVEEDGGEGAGADAELYAE